MAYYSFIETTFWLSSPALQVFLLMWAVRKRLFSAFPAFFWYLAFALAKTAVLYPMRRVASVSYYYYSQSIGMQPVDTHRVRRLCLRDDDMGLFLCA